MGKEDRTSSFEISREHLRAMFGVGAPVDADKLRVIDGIIHYKIYAQDGSMIEMECADTVSNRNFVSWVQGHDRYTLPGDASANEAIGGE